MTVRVSSRCEWVADPSKSELVSVASMTIVAVLTMRNGGIGLPNARRRAMLMFQGWSEAMRRDFLLTNTPNVSIAPNKITSG